MTTSMAKKGDFSRFLLSWIFGTLGVLLIGFSLGQRQGLWVSFLLTTLFILGILRRWVPRNFQLAQQWLQEGNDPWNFRKRIESLSNSYWQVFGQSFGHGFGPSSLLFDPAICILPQKEFVALAFGPRGRRPILCVSEGLLQSLDEQDRDHLAVFLLTELVAQHRWIPSIWITLKALLPSGIFERSRSFLVDVDTTRLGGDRRTLGLFLWKLMQTQPSLKNSHLPDRVMTFTAFEKSLSPLFHRSRLDSRLRNLVGYFPI